MTKVFVSSTFGGILLSLGFVIKINTISHQIDLR